VISLEATFTPYNNFSTELKILLAGIVSVNIYRQPIGIPEKSVGSVIKLP
jgi:hypothetical protein